MLDKLRVNVRKDRQKISIARRGEQLAGAGQRQGDLEAGSFADLAFDVDVAPVVADYAVADGEAEPRPLADLLRCEERVVDLRQVFGRDAEAVVADFDHGGILVR